MCWVAQVLVCSPEQGVEEKDSTMNTGRQLGEEEGEEEEEEDMFMCVLFILLINATQLCMLCESTIYIH